jgi:hypothetical protein
VKDVKIWVFSCNCLLGFSLFVDDYFQSAGISESIIDAIAKLVNAKDHGFTAFFEATCPDCAVLRPLDSIHQVHQGRVIKAYRVGTFLWFLKPYF